MRPPRRVPAVLSVLVATAAALAGCGRAELAVPRCEGGQRLGIMAQSVPSAAYVPCVAELPTGWSFTGFEVDDGGAELTLRSDRAADAVTVALSGHCETATASPVTPRADGARTYLLLRSVSPAYAGHLLDVFPGGCVASEFRFERGPHIGLMDELQRAVGLYPRRELRQELREQLGVELDP